MELTEVLSGRKQTSCQNKLSVMHSNLLSLIAVGIKQQRLQKKGTEQWAKNLFELAPSPKALWAFSLKLLCPSFCAWWFLLGYSVICVLPFFSRVSVLAAVSPVDTENFQQNKKGGGSCAPGCLCSIFGMWRWSCCGIHSPRNQSHSLGFLQLYWSRELWLNIPTPSGFKEV